MSTDDLLSIGVFSVVTGLSINALRHYDETGLLRPAFVDPDTGYRRYQLAHAPNAHGVHHGPTGTSRFGILVSDVDAAHQRALDAGAAEHYPPVDKPWKPRSSCVIDPSGNWIDLAQA